MARQCGLSQSTVSRIWHVSAAVVAEHDKHEQQAKSQGGNEEEVDRDDGSGVSRQEGVPSRRRPRRGSTHGLGHRELGDVISEEGELRLDAPSAPSRILPKTL